MGNGIANSGKKKKTTAKKPLSAGAGNDIPFDSCILKPASDL